MTTELLIALAAFAFVSSITPGPNNLMVMASSANFGAARTLPHFAGVILGFNFMIWMVGIGVSKVFEAWPVSLMILKFLSVVFLLYLAWKIATMAAPQDKETSTGKPLNFFQAAAFQWINPKAWALSLAAVGAYASAANPIVSVAIIAGVFLAAGIPSVASWLFLGTQLRRLFSDPKKLRLFNWACAALLAASVWPILFSAQH